MAEISMAEIKQIIGGLYLDLVVEQRDHALTRQAQAGPTADVYAPPVPITEARPQQQAKGL